jgi:hypothetical protein
METWVLYLDRPECGHQTYDADDICQADQPRLLYVSSRIHIGGYPWEET